MARSSDCNKDTELQLLVDVRTTEALQTGMRSYSCYDYMEAFKRVMDSTSKVQMDYICQQYPGYFRFAKLY
ncbi:hypothetical protein ACQLT9_004526 [Salmonella enterica subsp. diarizonae]